MNCKVCVGNMRYYTILKYEGSNSNKSWSQLPRGLRHRSAAFRLLRLWVQIPLGAWTFVSFECCQVDISAMSWSLVQRSLTNSDTSCVILKPCEWEGPGPQGAVMPETNKQNNKRITIASHRAETLSHDLQNMKQQCYLLCGDKE